MKKEYLTEMLANRVVKAPMDRRFYFPREEQLREPLTVHFAVNFGADGAVLSVRRSCNLSCSCDKCPFKKLCDDIEERIHM